jgi:hypothetical protein
VIFVTGMHVFSLAAAISVSGSSSARKDGWNECQATGVQYLGTQNLQKEGK